jgi:hypothetical protein
MVLYSLDGDGSSHFYIWFWLSRPYQVYLQLYQILKKKSTAKYKQVEVVW